MSWLSLRFRPQDLSYSYAEYKELWRLGFLVSSQFWSSCIHPLLMLYFKAPTLSRRLEYTLSTRVLPHHRLAYRKAMKKSLTKSLYAVTLASLRQIGIRMFGILSSTSRSMSRTFHQLQLYTFPDLRICNSYRPGDVAVIRPLISAPEVDSFLVDLGWSSQADSLFTFSQSPNRKSTPGFSTPI